MILVSIHVQNFHYLILAWEKVIIFGADVSSLILGKGPTQELDNTTLTAEAEYFINFTQLRK